MKSFTQTLALAGLLAHQALAVCVMNSQGSDAHCATDAGMKIQAAMVDYAGDYSWTLEDVKTEDGYDLGMIRFTGNAAGDKLYEPPIETPGEPPGPGATLVQGRFQALLITHTATKDCVDWLTASAAAVDSIPKRLFDEGYDVFLGCRRGTEYSRAVDGLDLETPEGQQMYFDYNTQTVGENDVPALVAAANALRLADQGIAPYCNRMQILTHGLGAGEALAGLAANALIANQAEDPDNAGTLISSPAPLGDVVEKVTNLAPCVVTTYQQHDDSQDEQGNSHNADGHHDHDHSHGWRLLRALTSRQLEAVEEPRELSDIVEEDMPRRELWSHSYESYWDRTERYCEHYPDNCFKYCDWYPHYCDAFCERFPQFCIPDEVKNFYDFLDLVAELEIYSFYGPNWADQVTAICEKVDTASCDALTATVSTVEDGDAGYREMSVQQLEHMWQQSYTGRFMEYNDAFRTSFAVDAAADALEDGIATIDTTVANIYVQDDQVCTPSVQQDIFKTMAYQEPYILTVTNEDHKSILDASDNDAFMSLLLASLRSGIVEKEDANGFNTCKIDD